MKTCVLQFQTDIRKLAAIAEWMATEGLLPKTRGGVAGACFDAFYERLVAADKAIPIDSVADAQTTLENLGLRPTKRDMRVVKKLSEAIDQEEPTDSISSMAAEAARLHEQNKENPR